ncbi:MAG: type III PLP-dependent enzyme, partial [Pseudomonadota bacterium]
ATCPDAELYLMHPVKSRQTIRHAYDFGVRHFAFDCAAELGKILVETNDAADLHLHLRLALPKGGSATMPLDGKYGADFDEAVDLLQRARPVSAKLGVCFHVGSQCMDPADYIKALSYVHGLLEAADVQIDSLDCGGGFPVAYPGMTPPPMQDYFARIQKGIEIFGFGGLEIIGEPGRALCGEGGSTLTRVELRKGQDLYLNEGSYGSLFDAAQCAWKYPVRLHREDEASDELRTFRFFGPTCDSLDTMAGPFHLPADTREGDWIEICHLGAYGQAMATDFNGFQSDATVAILGS